MRLKLMAAKFISQCCSDYVFLATCWLVVTNLTKLVAYVTLLSNFGVVIPKQNSGCILDNSQSQCCDIGRPHFLPSPKYLVFFH